MHSSKPFKLRERVSERESERKLYIYIYIYMYMFVFVYVYIHVTLFTFNIYARFDRCICMDIPDYPLFTDIFIHTYTKQTNKQTHKTIQKKKITNKQTATPKDTNKQIYTIYIFMYIYNKINLPLFF